MAAPRGREFAKLQHAKGDRMVLLLYHKPVYAAGDGL